MARQTKPIAGERILQYVDKRQFVIFLPCYVSNLIFFLYLYSLFVFGFRWNIGVNIYITIRKLQGKRYD